MRTITDEKIERLLEFMKQEQVDVLYVYDNEDARDVNLHYLCGHPMDANLLITSSGETILLPWDLSIAKDLAQVDEIVDIAQYNYNSAVALKTILEQRVKAPEKRMGVLRNFTYSTAMILEEQIPGIKFHKQPFKFSQFLGELRATKSPHEIELLKKAAQIGSETITDIKHFLQNASKESEKDLAFHVQQKMARRGADDLAFPTLVGNANRAHMLHCHPYASNEEVAVPGLGIIDFGANYKGYNSDITVPFGFGELNETQQKMKEISFKAYDAAVEKLEIGVPLWQVHQTAQDILTEAGFPMPYALGHGIGLSEHDAPYLSRKPTDEIALKYWKEVKLEDGMVFTIEPGAYRQGFGGTRIENDVAVLNGKIEAITKSEFIQVD